MTQQFGQALMWSSSFFRSSAPSDSSRKSDSSAKNCLQVSKGILHLFLEECSQFISKLQARPQQPALHGGGLKIQGLSRFLGPEPFHVSPGQDGAVRRRPGPIALFLQLPPRAPAATT